MIINHSQFEISLFVLLSNIFFSSYPNQLSPQLRPSPPWIFVPVTFSNSWITLQHYWIAYLANQLVQQKILNIITNLLIAPVAPDPAKMRTSSSCDALKAFFRIFLDSSLIRCVLNDDTLVAVCVFP